MHLRNYLESVDTLKTLVELNKTEDFVAALNEAQGKLNDENQKKKNMFKKMIFAEKD